MRPSETAGRAPYRQLRHFPARRQPDSVLGASE
nr:MAG TPA: hypothetical protein [Caudoviricetes sp.]